MEIEIERDHTNAPAPQNNLTPGTGRGSSVALLTGGSDKPYVFGIATELTSKGVAVDLIGSDELDCPEIRDIPGVHFINMRGDQNADAGLLAKARRVTQYYGKLLRYAATAKPKIFHILWNSRFQFVDRTLIMFYYTLVGKKVVLTVHNVNTRKRDGTDSALNRLTLRIQYQMARHLFVHTEKMHRELIEDYGVQPARISVIPFGINNAVPNTSLTPAEAKKRLGIEGREKAVLFFGRITEYKGLEYLVEALKQIQSRHETFRLIIAGKPGIAYAEYWNKVQESIRVGLKKDSVLIRGDFIPDEETEVYFKAADALVLPYKDIYQSGVLFLGHSFGLPVLAADVGSLKDDIVEGSNGLVFKPEDPTDLARALEEYFSSELYANLDARREAIREDATRLHSWDIVGQMTLKVYAALLGNRST